MLNSLCIVSFSIIYILSTSTLFAENNLTLLEAVKKNEKLVSIVKLINSKTDINQKDKNGNTPIIIATKDMRFKLIKALLKAGANPYLKNNKNENAITILEKNSQKNKKIRYLMKNTKGSKK